MIQWSFPVGFIGAGRDCTSLGMSVLEVAAAVPSLLHYTLVLRHSFRLLANTSETCDRVLLQAGNDFQLRH